MASRELFVEQRKDGLGGSDIASVFNAGYGCRRRLWYDKRGVAPDFPKTTSRAMQLGTFMEELVAQWYEEDTGRRVWGVERQRHPEHPELAVNVDRMVEPRDRPEKGIGVLEIKSFGVGMYAKTRREGLPEDYILQLQHGMLVTGKRWGSFAVGSRDNGAVTFWDVERDERLCDLILREGIAFWGLVENGPMPEALEPDDRRCQSCEWRTQCQGNALIRLDPETGGELQKAEDLRDLLVAWEELNALYCHKLPDGSRGTETDFRMEEVKEQLRDRLGTRTAVVAGQHKVYYRGQAGRVSWDAKLASAYDQLWRGAMDQLRERGDAVAIEAFSETFPTVEKYRNQGNPFRVLRIY